MVKSLKVWSTSSRRITQHAEAADNALRFFTKRSVLKCWKAAYEQKKREAWVAQRETEVMKGAFERKSQHEFPPHEMVADVIPVWMTATVQAVEDRRSVAIYQKGSNEVSFTPPIDLTSVATLSGYTWQVDSPSRRHQISRTRCD